jgi:transmembrane sensor
MPNPRIQWLVDQHFSGSSTEAEKEELAAWVGQAADDKTLAATLEQAWQKHEPLVFMPGEMSERVLSSVFPPVRRHIFIRSRWAAAAAILILLAGVSIYIFRPKTTQPIAAAPNDIAPGGNKAILTLANGQQIFLDSARAGMLVQQGNARIVKTAGGQLAYTIIHGQPVQAVYNTLTTPRGGQYKIQLPDGTGVWLNSASSIRYPTAFTGAERKVQITGEAYFEVAKDKAKPFHVEVAAMDIAVLGTNFNINAYADEGSIRATLLAGKIAVALTSGRQRPVILSPGQQAQVDQRRSINVINNPDIEQVMAWRNGLFKFDQADLQTVLRQLSRWYDITVKYEGAIPVGHFNGELPRNLTLAQVVSILSEMEVKFTIEGKTLIVKP